MTAEKDEGNGRGDGDTGLLEFPCRYEIKAMGRDNARFEALVQEIVSRHIGRDDLRATLRKHSRNDRYLSVTCIIWATSRAQVETIYSELHACPEVLVTL